MSDTFAFRCDRPESTRALNSVAAHLNQRHPLPSILPPVAAWRAELDAVIAEATERVRVRTPFRLQVDAMCREATERRRAIYQQVNELLSIPPQPQAKKEVPLPAVRRKSATPDLEASDETSSYLAATKAHALAKNNLGDWFTYKQFTKAIKAYGVRTYKPSPQRLLVHPGDLCRLIEQLKDPLDLPSTVVDAAVQEVQERLALAQARKVAE